MSMAICSTWLTLGSPFSSAAMTDAGTHSSDRAPLRSFSLIARCPSSDCTVATSRRLLRGCGRHVCQCPGCLPQRKGLCGVRSLARLEGDRDTDPDREPSCDRSALVRG